MSASQGAAMQTSTKQRYRVALPPQTSRPAETSETPVRLSDADQRATILACSLAGSLMVLAILALWLVAPAI
jgi:hypothetical protein